MVKYWNRLPWGCGISILGDTKNPTGQGSEQPALVDSAFSRGVD